MFNLWWTNYLLRWSFLNSQLVLVCVNGSVVGVADAIVLSRVVLAGAVDDETIAVLLQREQEVRKLNAEMKKLSPQSSMAMTIGLVSPKSPSRAVQRMMCSQLQDCRPASGMIATVPISRMECVLFVQSKFDNRDLFCGERKCKMDKIFQRD